MAKRYYPRKIRTPARRTRVTFKARTPTGRRTITFLVRRRRR